MTSRETRNGPRRFSARVSSQPSAGIWWSGPSPKRRPLPPATAKSPSIRPELLGAGGDRVDHLGLDGHVRGPVRGPTARQLDPLGEPATVGLGPRHDEERRSLGREAHGGGLGDTRRAGDEAGPA